MVAAGRTVQSLAPTGEDGRPLSKAAAAIACQEKPGARAAPWRYARVPAVAAIERPLPHVPRSGTDDEAGFSWLGVQGSEERGWSLTLSAAAGEGGSAGRWRSATARCPPRPATPTCFPPERSLITSLKDTGGDAVAATELIQTDGPTLLNGWDTLTFASLAAGSARSSGASPPSSLSNASSCTAC
jgi:hypothetical protein